MMERELNLIDMCWSIVEQWRKIIIFIIIGIVLTLGYQSYNILNKAAAAEAHKDYSDAVRYAKSQLTTQEILRVETLQKMHVDSLMKQSVYLENKKSELESLSVESATDEYYKNNLIISAISAETSIAQIYNQITMSLANFTDSMLYYYYLLDDPDNYEQAYAKVYHASEYTDDSSADYTNQVVLTETQQAYVDAQEASAIAQAALAAIPSSAINVKNIILGILVGILIAALALSILYILSSKLKFIDDIESCFKIANLSKILVSEPKLGIDKWIFYCRYRKIHPLTQAVAINNMTSLIKLTVDRSEEDKKVAILGECQYAVVMETADVDTYDHLYNELQLLKRYGIEVVGASYVK